MNVKTAIENKIEQLRFRRQELNSLISVASKLEFGIQARKLTDEKDTLIEWIDFLSYLDTIRKNEQNEDMTEIIGQFMNWFLRHYSTATIDGMFGYVDSMEKEVTIQEIIKEYIKIK